MPTKVVVLAAAVFTLIYNLLFFQTGIIGLGLGVLFLLTNVYFFLLAKKENPDLIFGLASSILAIIFGFLIAFRGNEVVQIINFFTAGFCTMTAIYFYQQPGRFSPQIFSFLILPLLTIKNSLASLLNVRVEKSDSSNTDSIIRGLVLSGGVISILMLLLGGADPIFGKLTENFFGSFAERLIVSAFIFGVFFVLGLKQFLTDKGKEKEKGLVNAGKASELGVILGSVGILLLIFIMVQVRYLFSSVGERELSELGINSLTYSEYVRKGFFELLFASTITSGVILYTLGFIHRLSSKSKTIIQILAGFLTIETGLLLLSAIKRLTLYTDAHGLTRARIFGFIFLVWLALILLVVLYRIVKEMKTVWWFILTLGITLEALLAINLINVDGLMTDKFKPTVNKEVDYFYLTNISTDASASWNAALADAQNILGSLKDKKSLDSEDYRKIFWTRETLINLMNKRDYLKDKYGSNKGGWQTFNLSEYQTYHEGLLNSKLDELKNEADRLDGLVPDVVKSTTILDRSTESPLTK